jgi:hypothetical protein
MLDESTILVMPLHPEEVDPVRLLAVIIILSIFLALPSFAQTGVTVTGISSYAGTVSNAPYPGDPPTTGTSPILYVSWFGVQCDGVTDDTEAFKNLATTIRSIKGATVIFPTASTCLVWSTGGVGGDVLFDLSNTDSVQFYGNGSTLLAGNVHSLITTAFDLNASTNTLIDGLILRSEYTSLDPNHGVDWIIARRGANEIVLRNLACTYGQICFASKGEGMVGQGSDTNRVRNITATNIACTTVYYCLNFQSAGDNFYARGITGRNCGRIYFPWNVRNHDVWIDSEQGGPFTDVLLKVYTQSGMYSRLENIKLVYWSDGRYPGSGDQSTDEAMIALEFQLNDANNLPGMIQNIDITLNVDAGLNDKNQSVLAIRKVDLNGHADTTGRGHQLSAVTIRGMCRSLANLLTDAFRLFTRSPDNWTGDFVSLLTLENLSITGATTAVNIDGQGLTVAGATLRNINSDGALTQSNTAGKPFYTSRANFSNLTDGMLMDGTVFANLGAPNNKTETNPCTSGGTEALAKRLNGILVCQ